MSNTAANSVVQLCAGAKRLRDTADNTAFAPVVQAGRLLDAIKSYNQAYAICTGDEKQVVAWNLAATHIEYLRRILKEKSPYVTTLQTCKLSKQRASSLLHI
jgi:hypothetical protein